ncbi:MAG: hypothetical protein IBJ10_05500 [Phycisphaerales bacterium]|nr:hypothetical protein [Phycisphaerales bacterium]
MSTIAGQSLFNSGPHRFLHGRVGRLWAPPLRLDSLQDRIVVFPTNLELVIRQEGRLVGASEADLWAQAALIQARCQSLLTGALVDNSGNTWTGMTLIEFAPESNADRGRAVSLAYGAMYARLL